MLLEANHQCTEPAQDGKEVEVPGESLGRSYVKLIFLQSMLLLQGQLSYVIAVKSFRAPLPSRHKERGCLVNVL